ncbi:glycosyltransferase family 4 protein [Chryseobacterium binzhouense]|uniref:glycosyltransferase family 4 protein n=1 Tax=Chryseobacterium binzhouense TaxID=2593646 RepID=UPI00117CFC92|nr:glycosyltransferase family 1 protein [Chryseobacterium binzhouense]
MSRKKNILFYIPNLSQDAGGVRQYAAGLLNLFTDLIDKYHFCIYHDGNDEVIMNILIENPHLKHIKSQDYDFTKKEIFNQNLLRIYNRSKNLLIKKISFNKMTILDKIISLNNIDIIHCPYQYIPQKKNVKLITTLHDVQELYFPEFFTAEQRAYRAVHYKDYIDRADKVIVSYQHVKNDLVKFFAKDSNKIDVLLLKMNKLWFSKYLNHKFTKPTSVPEKFLLYPANFWKHKNHEKLVETIKYIKEHKGISVNLVLTGDHNFDHGRYITRMIKKYQLDNQIIILGIVDELTLYNLYKTTIGVVVPTLYEAGSFPLMESILMEIPVICSSTTSLPETIGNADFIFDPLSIEDMAEKILKLWLEVEYRTRSTNNCRKQQQRLIETDASQKLNKIYSDLHV